MCAKFPKHCQFKIEITSIVNYMYGTIWQPISVQAQIYICLAVDYLHKCGTYMCIVHLPTALSL